MANREDTRATGPSVTMHSPEHDTQVNVGNFFTVGGSFNPKAMDLKAQAFKDEACTVANRWTDELPKASLNVSPMQSTFSFISNAWAWVSQPANNDVVWVRILGTIGSAVVDHKVKITFKSTMP